MRSWRKIVSEEQGGADGYVHVEDVHVGRRQEHVRSEARNHMPRVHSEEAAE